MPYALLQLCCSVYECAESSSANGLIYVLVSLVFRAHCSGKRILHNTVALSIRSHRDKKT